MPCRPRLLVRFLITLSAAACFFRALATPRLHLRLQSWPTRRRWRLLHFYVHAHCRHLAQICLSYDTSGKLSGLMLLKVKVGQRPRPTLLELMSAEIVPCTNHPDRWWYVPYSYAHVEYTWRRTRDLRPSYEAWCQETSVLRPLVVQATWSQGRLGTA